MSEAVARAARVRDAMLDGVLKEAFDHIEAEYTRSLIDTHDRDERDNLWRAIQIMRKMRQQLSTWEAGAMIAERQITEIRRIARAR